MKKIRNKINVIFTGKFLPCWYGACILTLLIMAYGYYKSSTVDKYLLTVFNSRGQAVSQKVISKDELQEINDLLPVTKSFKPLK